MDMVTASTAAAADRMCFVTESVRLGACTSRACVRVCAVQRATGTDVGPLALPMALCLVLECLGVSVPARLSVGKPGSMGRCLGGWMSACVRVRAVQSNKGRVDGGCVDGFVVCVRV